MKPLYSGARPWVLPHMEGTLVLLHPKSLFLVMLLTCNETGSPSLFGNVLGRTRPLPHKGTPFPLYTGGTHSQYCYVTSYLVPALGVKIAGYE